MKYDSDTDTGTEPLTVAGNEDNMTQAVKTPTAKKAVKAKPAKAKAKAKPAKKAVKAKAKPAKKPAKKAVKAKKTNGKVKKPAAKGTYGDKSDTVLTMLKKGVTRAELLAKLGWNAINVYQFVPKTKLVVAKTEGVRGLTYRLRK